MATSQSPVIDLCIYSDNYAINCCQTKRKLAHAVNNRGMREIAPTCRP